MNFHEIISAQREYFNSGNTRSINARLTLLAKIRLILTKYEPQILIALKADLNKSATESFMMEIGVVLSDLTYMEKHLKKLMSEKIVNTKFYNFPAKSFISPEPFGVTLIMSPWNYPIMLTFEPLIGSLAAGNTAIIKPSNYAPKTSKLIADLIKKFFNPKQVAVITGGREENQALLNEKFDYIFFTGSPAVGRFVMEKAAKNLTPLTLELGGKSPCIVDKTANIKIAARRIAFGKFINAGQTCIAPDYLFIDESVKTEFVNEFKKCIKRFFGVNPLQNASLGKIINEKHFSRLLNLIDSENIILGGNFNRATLQIEPTVLDNITYTSPIMQEEIFGPILPIITFKNIKQITDYIVCKEKPLALYIFTENKKIENYILNKCSFGGGCINDTIMHVSQNSLPFGGVGNSGMGCYHGKSSFDTFTHYRSILKKSTFIDIPIRYYPYSKGKNYLIKKFMK